ncbi:hypothetical protein P7K49_006723 [Saguinus oedipus]|uniref:Exocyst complex component 7 n=1 Tax=Saguinus oedipus TaxID=9490 RepID=A0ABQ9W372_SAGOE|nr:hypothetical protein P7K49_006723 [Saguinus oedipus]
MAKTQKVVEYFQDKSSDSPKHNKVKLLFEQGKESLESELCSLMTRHNKVVSLVRTLDLICGDDDLEVQEVMSLEHLPKSVLQDICSSQLDHSIKALEKYFWKNSSFSGIPYSPSIPNKRKNTPTKKPVKWPGTIHKTIHGANKDGIMLTSKVILFLQQLWTSKRCSGSLQVNLLSKSKVYEDPALSTIFLHNNYSYILKSLKSELLQLVAVTQETAEHSHWEHIEQ